MTGACETCGAAASSVQQPCRSLVGKRRGVVYAPTASGKRPRSVSAAPQESQSEKGRGIRNAVLFLYATSLSYEDAPLGWDTVPWVGCRLKRDRALRWVVVPAGAMRRTTTTPAMLRTKARSNAPSPPPNDRSDQLQSPDGCPAAGGISSEPPDGCPVVEGIKHSNRRTGPGTESYVKSVGSGPRCLRRARSNPQRQHSLVGDPSRERIRSVRSYPGNRDRAPKISMVGNLGKAKQHGHYHSLRSIKRGLAAPPRQIPQSVNRNRQPAQLLPPPSKAE